MSLKDRIREAQIEAARRLGLNSRRNGIGKASAASSKGSGDGDEPTAPTVEEIRLALLHKSSNGKTIE